MKKDYQNHFWAKAVCIAVYLMNRCPIKAVWDKTPFEAWSGRKPSIKHLKVFGCICYVQIPKEKRYKLDETSEKYIFVGYSSMSKGYRLYNLETNKVIISRDVLFDEKAKWNWEQGQVEEQLVSVTVLQQGPAEGSASNDDSTYPSSSSTASPSSPSSLSSSSTSPSSSPIRLRNLDDIYARCNFCLVEPENFEEAMKEES
jgi:hypothetical protein